MPDEHDARDKQKVALEQYRNVLAYLQYENTMYWSRTGVMMVAQAAMIGLIARSLPTLHPKPDPVPVTMTLCAGVFGLLLCWCWLRANKGGRSWIDRWHGVILLIEGDAYKDLQVFRGSAPDGTRIQVKPIADHLAWLFVCIWSFMVIYGFAAGFSWLSAEMESLGGLMTITTLLFSAALGLITGVAGSFIGFQYWPALRRRAIRNSLRIVDVTCSQEHGLMCRVFNGSSYSMEKAVVYLSITHETGDIVEGDETRPAHIRARSTVKIQDQQLCWAVQEGESNPMRVDIYAGEPQPLTIAFIHDDFIEVLSEKERKVPRAYLARKHYGGNLRIVCRDCPAKEFPIVIDPIGNPPLRIG